MGDCWAFVQGVAEAIKEPVSVLGTLAAIYIGFTGLATWRRQLHGSSKYAIARAILLEAYRMQEALSAVRDPVVIYERKEAEEKGKMFAVGQVYEERMRPVVEHWVKLRALELEAAVLWGDEVKGALDDLIAAGKKLRTAIGLHLLSRYDDDPAANPSAEDLRMAKEATKTVWGREDDEFTAQLVCAMKAVEDRYRPLMR